jgi:hypothetical protein
MNQSHRGNLLTCRRLMQASLPQLLFNVKHRPVSTSASQHASHARTYTAHAEPRRTLFPLHNQHLTYLVILPFYHTYKQHRQIPASIWKTFRKRVHRAQLTVTYAKPCARPSPASSSPPNTPCGPVFFLSPPSPDSLLHLPTAKNQSPARGWVS